jgi:hypothetical protein
MTLDAQILQQITEKSPAEAWQFILERVLQISSQDLAVENAVADVIRRDREIGELDLFLSSSGWDLWQSLASPTISGVERTSDRLAQIWQEPYSAYALLILDALSLRELPWLLQGARARGLTINSVSITSSELPGETNEFARALGFASRSQLQANGAGLAHKLQPAVTETVDLPWQDCESIVNDASGAKNWIFWHHWPDAKLHDYGAGQGLELLTKDAAAQLNSDEFWSFVQRLAQGRKLIITSDHGYAATGYFPDASGDVAAFLKQTFSSGRSKGGGGDTGPFIPPVALEIDSPHGTHRMALGRRKWRSPGGYPTLTHGGLSLLEVLCPFVEISLGASL